MEMDKTDLELCFTSKENFGRLVKEHEQLQKGFGPLFNKEEEEEGSGTTEHKAMFMQELPGGLKLSDVDAFLSFDELSSSSQESIPVDVTQDTDSTIEIPKEEEGIVVDNISEMLDNHDIKKHEDTMNQESYSSDDEETSMAESELYDEEENEDINSVEAITLRLSKGYKDARKEIFQCVRNMFQHYKGAGGFKDERIADPGLWARPTSNDSLDSDALERLENVILARCFHWDVDEDEDVKCPEAKNPSTREPLYKLDYQTWCMFVCAVVFEACRQARARACLKANTKAMTSVGHPVLKRCGKRDAFEDFFNGVNHEKSALIGIRGLWDRLIDRVCRRLPNDDETVLITSPIYSLLSLMKDADSIEWCEAHVPMKPEDSFYCSMTGAKLKGGEACYAGNIRTNVIHDVEDTEKTLPTRDVIDNPFLIGHKVSNTPLGNGNDVEPIYLLKAMVALAQVDLVIKKSIAEWLDAESSYLPKSEQNNDALIIANVLTSDIGIEKIVEWYSYLYHICYVLDVSIPPEKLH